MTYPFNAAHEGYMDGLSGKEPQSTCDEYETGWLYGTEDRGSVDPKTFETVLKKGDTVRIPKGTTLLYDEGTCGRTITVQLHDVFPMIPAHLDHTRYRNGRPFQEFFVRPRPPVILWAGSGGYWKHAYAHHACKKED